MLRLDTPSNTALRCSRAKLRGRKLYFSSSVGVEMPAAGLDLTANRQQRCILLSPRSALNCFSLSVPNLQCNFRAADSDNTIFPAGGGDNARELNRPAASFQR